MFVGFNARDVTFFLRRPPASGGGPSPPGLPDGTVQGHIRFGDASGPGSTTWDLVPEPRTATEVKRAYVTTTARHMFTRPPAPAAIDYAYDPNTNAWPFNVRALPGATAIVVVVGLYDPARDPYGNGVVGFEPFAMGVERGVLVGPGETVDDLEVVVDIPLNTDIQVDLIDPPALGTPGWDGPDNYTIKPFIDLGSEGVIAMNVNGLARPHPSEPRPNEFSFLPGTESIVLSRMAPLTGSLAGASYTFQVGAWTGTGVSPFSVRILRGVSDGTSPVEIGAFLGTPRPADPLPEQTASARAMMFAPEGPAAGDATFHVHYLQTVDGVRLLTAFTSPDLFNLDIPDLSAVGFGVVPAGTQLAWTIYRIRVPGMTFDKFTYQLLSGLYWEAYAADANFVQFPE